eukprot:tig00021742_g23330.t1
MEVEALASLAASGRDDSDPDPELSAVVEVPLQSTVAAAAGVGRHQLLLELTREKQLLLESMFKESGLPCPEWARPGSAFEHETHRCPTPDTAQSTKARSGGAQ